MTTAAAESPAKTRRRFPKPVLLLSAMLSIVAAIYFGLAAMTVTPSNDANAATSAPTAADPSGVSSPPVGLLAPVASIPAELTDRLEVLHRSINDLTTLLNTSITHQETMQAEISAIKVFTETQQAATEAAAARAKRAVATKRTPPLSQQQSGVAPVVLSVDLWDGKPSAVLRGLDGRIRYANTGDRIPFGVIGQIQAASQTVVIKYDDGSVATLAARQTP